MRTKLSNGHWFVSIQDKPTDEIYGWNETEQGDVIPKSSGWYRTTSHEAAARIAELNVQCGLEVRK